MQIHTMNPKYPTRTITNTVLYFKQPQKFVSFIPTIHEDEVSSCLMIYIWLTLLFYTYIF